MRNKRNKSPKTGQSNNFLFIMYASVKSFVLME